MDEASIIQRVQEGDSEAFGRLIDLHVDRVRRALALTVPAAHLIDELAHETFVFAFTHVHGFKRGASFAGWLAAIARNLVRREILRFSRERANRARYAEQKIRQTATRENGSVRLDRLEKILRHVEPHARKLIEWRYRDSLPTAEIARRLGRGDSWVRTSLLRLRQELRLVLESR